MDEYVWPEGLHARTFTVTNLVQGIHQLRK